MLCARGLSARPGRTRGLLQRLCDPWRPSFRVCRAGARILRQVDDDPTADVGQRQRLGLGDDRLALCAREPPPGLNRDRFPARRHVPTIFPATSSAPGHTRGVHSSPRWPASGHEERTIVARDAQGVGIAARQESGGGAGGAESRERLARRARGARRRPTASRPGAARRRGRRTSATAVRAPIARPLGEPLRRRRTEDVQVAARQLAGRLLRARSPAAARSRRSAAVRPPSGSRACRSTPRSEGCSRAFRARARRRRTSFDPRRGRRAARSARSSARRRIIPLSGSRPSVNTAQVARGDDVHVVPRTPDLHERRVLPGGRSGAFHARVDREERGARHAVLQPGPRGLPQRPAARRESLVQRSDAPSDTRGSALACSPAPGSRQQPISDAG